MDATDLLELKERITKSKSRVSELTGQQSLLMKELEDEWGCKTLEKGQSKSTRMSGEIDDLEDKIEVGISDLETKYNL